MDGDAQEAAEMARKIAGDIRAYAGTKSQTVVASNGSIGNVDLISTAANALGDVAYHWDIASGKIHWADGAAEMLGFGSPDEISTEEAYSARLLSQNGSCRFDLLSESSGADTGAGVLYELEYQVRGKGGSPHWIEDRGRWFADENGSPKSAVGVLRVIDRRHDRDDKLARLSTYDDLTGLYNRRRLKEALGEALNAAIGRRGSSAFLMLAVDNLSMINESYGFDIADEVIVGVGQRLRDLARRVDVIGRYSGNKFGLVLGNCDKDRLVAVTERLLASIRDQAIKTSHGPVAATLSAGCVSLPAHAQSVEQALSNAEEALSVAKQMQRDSYVIFSPSRDRERVRQHNMNVTDELVSALNERRISLAYQPIVSSATGEVAMYEALIRLRQHDGSIVAAGNFVPIAEKLGLIGLLDFRAMELALDALREHPAINLSLNVSGRTASDPMWLDTLVAKLREDQGLAARLTVEITETMALHEIEGSAEFVKTLRDLGCQLAIDDFGAGYTSFRNLKHLEVDLVKIDGSFVKDLLDNKDNQFFVRTLVELAHNFKLPIVAEWVGSEEEVEMLREFGVEYLQGFYLGEPLMSLPNAYAQSGVDMKRA